MGVAGAPVRLAAAGGLTAVVSNVSLAEFGEEALRRNLEDLDWLERVARAHHGVIEAAARLFTLLPMRLAIVYSCEQTMRAGITADAGWFRSALERLRSRTEWGVKACAVTAAGPPASTLGRPAPTAGGDKPAGDKPGVTRQVTSLEVTSRKAARRVAAWRTCGAVASSSRPDGMPRRMPPNARGKCTRSWPGTPRNAACTHRSRTG